MSNYEVLTVILNMLFGIITALCMIMSLVFKIIQFIKETKNNRTPEKS